METKTPEDFLREHTAWPNMGDLITKNEAVEAMKEYAAQESRKAAIEAIEKCAAEAKVFAHDGNDY